MDKQPGFDPIAGWPERGGPARQPGAVEADLPPAPRRGPHDPKPAAQGGARPYDPPSAAQQRRGR